MQTPTHRAEASQVAGAMTEGLASYATGWWPEPLAAFDALDPIRAQQLGATLDLDESLGQGDALPPLWHWVYFPDWPATESLGPDGHPAEGHFLPPLPHRRRMFAGGRLTITSPLLLGEPTERRSSITDIAVKTGRTGQLMFVTVQHEYRQRGTVSMLEEQDIVYRSEEAPRTTFSRPGELLGGAEKAWCARPVTHPSLLFRFSALTSNAHRIHYDETYTMATEGYPALVVHGPLLAIYMAELARAHAGGRAIEILQFRFLKPVFVGAHIEVRGEPGDDTASMLVVSGVDTVHASASVRFA
jgi:3-methylfumaryl-CoA hydratase